MYNRQSQGRSVVLQVNEKKYESHVSSQGGIMVNRIDTELPNITFSTVILNQLSIIPPDPPPTFKSFGSFKS